MKLTAGKEAPELVNVVIENSMGSNIKYETDEESGMLKVDRVLYTAMAWPANYGEVPGTLGEDGDPIDAFVLSNHSFVPHCVIEARPVGMIEMTDESGIDTKILAVPKAKVDPDFANVNDVNDLPQPLKDKIKHFLEHYKELEKGKWVKITGFRSADEARKKIKEAMKRRK